MSKILIAGRPGGAELAVEEILHDHGFDVVHSDQGSSALEGARRESPSVIVLSSGSDSLLACQRLKDDPDLRYTPVILISEAEESQIRVKGLDLGADDTITEPIDEEELLAKIRAMSRIKDQYDELRLRSDRAGDLQKQVQERYSFDNIVGKGPAMQEVYDLLEKVITSDSTILISGESGTGKELVARAIHYNSHRRGGPFVVQNCSAFHENLLESELFGHVKGAFTTAVRDKQGLFEVADGGTLLLDEVAEMSPALQVKLLRILQEGTFSPVGSTEVRHADVRILAATNKDLETMVEVGGFREDLFYRLNVIHLRMPSLRERKEDLPLLLEHFLEIYSAENHVEPRPMNDAVAAVFMDYDWPGNVRELENEIERMVVLSRHDEEISENHISERMRSAHSKKQASRGRRMDGKLKDAIQDLEKEAILEGLRRHRWNKVRVARELGISRSGLIKKIQQYHLDQRRKPREGEPAEEKDERDGNQ